MNNVYSERDEVVDAIFAAEPKWLIDLALRYQQRLDSLKHFTWFRELVFEESQRKGGAKDEGS